jgi:hypothetical protein
VLGQRRDQGLMMKAPGGILDTQRTAITITSAGKRNLANAEASADPLEIGEHASSVNLV